MKITQRLCALALGAGLPLSASGQEYAAFIFTNTAGHTLPYGTWDAITRWPNRFAAAAPVCGGGDENVAPRAAKTPLWAFHSSDDNVVMVARTRNMIAALRAAGGQPKYFEYSGLGHNSWDQAYREPEFLPWLFAQRLGQPDAYTLHTPAPQAPAVAK